MFVNISKIVKYEAGLRSVKSDSTSSWVPRPVGRSSLTKIGCAGGCGYEVEGGEIVSISVVRRTVGAERISWTALIGGSF